MSVSEGKGEMKEASSSSWIEEPIKGDEALRSWEFRRRVERLGLSVTEGGRREFEAIVSAIEPRLVEGLSLGDVALGGEGKPWLVVGGEVGGDRVLIEAGGLLGCLAAIAKGFGSAVNAV
jgi:hypothetical protein